MKNFSSNDQSAGGNTGVGDLPMENKRGRFCSAIMVILGASAELHTSTISFVTCVCLSVCPHGTAWLPLGRFSWNFKCEYFLKLCWENSSFIKIWQYTKTLYTFLTISRSFLLRMKNVLDKSCREIKTRFPCSKTYVLYCTCHLRYNMEKHGKVRQVTYDNILRRMRTTCYIPKATNTHSQYIILIDFPLQQWLEECSSTLRSVAYPGISFRGGCSTNSVEDRGQREQGSGSGSPLGVLEAAVIWYKKFHFIYWNFLNFWYFKTIYDDDHFICHCQCKTTANLGSFKIWLSYFRTSWGVGVLNSAILTVLTIGLSLARFWRAFGILGGGLNPPTPLGTPLAFPTLLLILNSAGILAGP